MLQRIMPSQRTMPDFSPKSPQTLPEFAPRSPAPHLYIPFCLILTVTFGNSMSILVTSCTGFCFEVLALSWNSWGWRLSTARFVQLGRNRDNSGDGDTGLARPACNATGTRRVNSKPLPSALIRCLTNEAEADAKTTGSNAKESPDVVATSTWQCCFSSLQREFATSAGGADSLVWTSTQSSYRAFVWRCHED